MYCVGIVCHSLTYDNHTYDRDIKSLGLPDVITAVAESKSKFTKMPGDFDT